MTTSIPPSTLHTLPTLPSAPAGSKVRFLGQTISYNPSSSSSSSSSSSLHPILTLSTPSTPVCARVDISIALPELPLGALRDGSWVWVVGYVRGVRGKEVDVDALSVRAAEAETNLWTARKVEGTVRALREVEDEMEEVWLRYRAFVD